MINFLQFFQHLLWWEGVLPSSEVAVTSVSVVEDKRQDMLPPHLMLSQLMVVTRMFTRSEIQ